MSYLDTLLLGAKVDWKKLWEVTIWDKRFNAVENFKQKITKKYNYLLANEIKPLILMDGSVKLLSTNETDWWTSEELAGNKISTGEIVAIPWGGNPIVQYYNGKFITGDNRIATSRDNNYLDTKYLYYFLKNDIQLLSSFYRGSGIKHPSMANVLDMDIPIPPLSVQQEIVRILDTFTQLTAELTAELTARKKQYEFYREQLFTFKEGEVEWKTLGEITSKFYSGSTPTAGNSRYYQNGTIPWLRTQEVRFVDIYDTEVKVTDLAINETAAKWIPKNCVIIAISGATAGRSAINKIPLTTNQHCLCLEINPEIASFRYVFHWISSNYIKIKELGQGARGDLNSGMIKKYKIPLPSIQKQKDIAIILDKFDTLTTSLSEGLPKEIELRKKQYEYYRDLLLTFPKEPAQD